MYRLSRRLDRRSKHPGLRDGVKGVARIDNPRTDGDGISLKAIWITFPIPSLMMVSNNVGNILLFRVFGKYLRTLGWMRLDDFVLLRSELAGLEQNRIWDSDLPQIVEDPSYPHRVAHFIAQMKEPSYPFGEFSYSL